VTESHERALRPSFIAAVLGVLLACLLTGTAAGAPGDVTVSQVADINMGASDSSPFFLTNVNGTLFFSANDGTNGSELWKSEPPYTTATTTMVANINPGAGSSGPTQLTNVNGTLFFSANDGSNGVELWKSNGGPLGPGGTEMVANINPTVGSSSPIFLTNVNGTLFFRAEDGTNGAEPWKSNGGALGPGGTEMVADIFTGAGNSSNPYSFTDVNGTLFFGANDGTNGIELWKSGNPYTSATIVANINTTAGVGSDPFSLTTVNNTLFFGADDGTSGYELWKSDGGALGMGTEMVANINPAASTGSDPDLLTSVNGTLFFAANDGTSGFEPWKSNGGALGPGGTEMVADINPTAGMGSNPSFVTAANGTLFFRANDGSFGAEVWKTLGTAATTTRVSDIFPGGSGSDPSSLTNVNGTLFFSAADPTTGRELWRTTIEGPAPPVVTPPAALTPTTPAPPKKKKKCKKKKKPAKPVAAAKKCKKKKR
jgi:ELWxxDGT repeat protein